MRPPFRHLAVIAAALFCASAAAGCLSVQHVSVQQAEQQDVGEIEVGFFPKPDGAELVLDGEPVATGVHDDIVVLEAVRTGSHTLQATRSGEPVSSTEAVEVERGKRAYVQLDMGKTDLSHEEARAMKAGGEPIPGPSGSRVFAQAVLGGIG